MANQPPPNDPKSGKPTAEPAKTAPTKELTMDERIAQAVSNAMAAALPSMAKEIASGFGTAMVAAQAAQAAMGHQEQVRALKAKEALAEKCDCCGQSVGNGKGRGCGGPWARNKDGTFKMEPVLEADGVTPALDGEGKPMMRRIQDWRQFHVFREVWPSDPIAAEWFDGVKLNGVWYKSQGPGHKVWVPAKNDIDYRLSVYQVNEVEQRVGRKHTRNNGGRLSQQGGYQGPPLGVGFQH